MIMKKITSDIVNRQAFKSIEESELLTKSQFSNLIKGNDYLVFDLNGLSQYRIDLFKKAKENPEIEADLIKQAKSEFASFIKKTVIMEGKETKDFFIKAKPEQQGNQDQDKGQQMNNQNPGQEEEEEDEEGEDDVDSDDLTSEEEEVLKVITNILSQGGEANADELAQQAGQNDGGDEGNQGQDDGGVSDGADDSADMNAILQSLADKGFITIETGEDGTINVLGLTSDNNGEEDGNGQQAPNQEGNAGNDGQQNQDPNQQGQSDPNPNQKQVPQTNTNTPDPNAAPPAQAGQQQGAGSPQDDVEQLKNHAKSTHSDKLKAFIANKDNHDAHKAIAKEELKNRGEDPDAQANPGADGAENPEEVAKKEFDGWIDKHFSSHDQEDLVSYVKDLILQSPGETKTLKDHFRNDYTQKHAGNSVSKVDPEEFKEYLDEYLGKMPFDHLIKYSKTLVSKNPKAFKSLKSNYEDLKSNNMLD